MNISPSRKPLLCAVVLCAYASVAGSQVVRREFEQVGKSRLIEATIVNAFVGSASELMKPGLLQVAVQGIAVAQAGPAITVQALNDAAKAIIAQFHTPPSATAVITVKNVAVDAQRTNSLSVSFEASKTARTTAKIQFGNVSYGYNNGQPSFSADGTADLNLLAVFPQAQIDEYYPEIVNLVKEQLSRSFGEYAHAVNVEQRITANPGTASENKPPVRSISLFVEAKVDFARLPASTAKAVPFKRVRVDISGQTLQRFTARVSGESNINSKYFQQGQVGLKEMLEKIQARDPETERTLRGYMRQVKDMVDQYVK
ncbi:MAG: hypothetical protein HY059_09095 [Proteobacteria bacterium]|nr:hypothetical protein [Pseudomonadota bacterium]